MSQNIITLTATNGETVRFVDEVKAQGGMKDVKFSPDRDYVVAFFREKADPATRERRPVPRAHLQPGRRRIPEKPLLLADRRR